MRVWILMERKGEDEESFWVPVAALTDESKARAIVAAREFERDAVIADWRSRGLPWPRGWRFPEEELVRLRNGYGVEGPFDVDELVDPSDG